MTRSLASTPVAPSVAARACAAIGALLALVIVPAIVPAVGRAAAAQPSEFRWSAAVRSPPIDEATLEAIVLDSSIFAVTRPDLADLRLRDQQGQPVAFLTETTGAKTARYPTTNFRTRQDPDHKQTVVEFDSRYEPISTVRLLTDETNFSRPASLEIPRADRGRDAWHGVATTTLLRLSLGTLAKDELALRCPEQRVERWRIVVENGDSPPIAFSGVEVEGPEYQLVFLALPGQSLTLDYGNAETPAPHYDTAAIAASLAAGNLPAQAQLAAPVENTAVKPVGVNWAALLADRWVLGCLIAGLSIILAWGLYRAARRIDSPPPA